MTLGSFIEGKVLVIERNGQKIGFTRVRRVKLKKIENFIKKFKIVDLPKHSNSVIVRDRAKWAKIWDHKGYKSQKNIFKNSKFKKKIKMAD